MISLSLNIQFYIQTCNSPPLNPQHKSNWQGQQKLQTYSLALLSHSTITLQPTGERCHEYTENEREGELPTN